MLLALVLRAWGLTWGLHNASVAVRAHPDEWALYYLFRWFNSTHSLNPCPDLAHSHCFFDWGAVYPYLAYSLHLVLSPLVAHLPAHAFGPHADPTYVYAVLAGRLVSVMASCLAVILLYRLGQWADGPAVGLLAALFLALSTLPIQLGHFATPDSTTLLFNTASLLAIVGAFRQPGKRRFVLAGVLVGLATGTEYHMALLGLPLAFAWFLAPGRKMSWLAAASASAIAVFVITNPYAVVEISGFNTALRHAVLSRTADSRQQYQNEFTRFGSIWLYVVRYALGYGIGFALTLCLVAGAIWGGMRRSRTDLILLAWVIPYFLLTTLSPAKYMRYSAPLIPALAVLAAGFLVWLVGSRSMMLRLGALAAGGLVVMYSWVYDASYAGLFSSAEPRTVALAWLEQHAPVSSRIGFDALPSGLTTLPVLVTRAGYRPCFAQFEPQQLGAPATYLMLDRYNVELHPHIADTDVTHFLSDLSRNPSYRLVERVHYVPSFLGFRFPIDGSPHDWRYPSHVISIYRHVSTSTVQDAHCYPSLHSALVALSVPAETGGS